jgi:hypothetical protein
MPIQQQPGNTAVAQALGAYMPQWVKDAAGSVQQATPDWIKNTLTGITQDPALLAQTSVPTPMGPMGGLVGKLAQEGGPALKALANRIIAWHGSPHDFDKFSLKKIGSGEGNQAYGHGMYFTDLEDIAKKYRDDLTEEVTPTVTLASGHAFRDPEKFANKFGRGQGDGWNAYVDAAMEAMHPEGTEYEKMILKPGQLTHAQDRIKFGMENDPESYLPARQKALALLQGHTLNSNDSGRLYQVAIKTAPEKLLNWDRQLAENSPGVQQAVQKVYGGQLNTRRSGGSIYESMANKGDPAAVSRALRGEGVPGIKYLDGMSRYKKDGGTSNYVVFDPKIVDILKKYGIVPGAAGLGKMLANQPPAEPEQ